MKRGFDHDNRLLVVSPSSFGAYHRCPRYFGYAVHQNLAVAPAGWGDETGNMSESPDIVFGRAYHKALDVLFTTQDLDAAKDAFT